MTRFTATIHVKCFDGDYDHHLVEFAAPSLSQAPEIAILRAAGELRGFIGLECTACAEIKQKAESGSHER